MTGKMHSGAAKPLYQMARDLRNSATHAETILWGYLKTKPLGFKFRRQHPYSIYILDFYCHSLKLVIEVDGNIHDLDKVKENDKHREELIQKDGLTIIRFENKQVEQSLQQVIKQVEDFIIKRKDEQER